MAKKGATYAQAGVDIDAGERFARMIAVFVAKAWPEAQIGGFADGGKIPDGATEFKAGADGVGTMIDLARRVRKLRVTGVNAVAMTAVDVYMGGIKPEAFYDYLVVECLDPELHIEIIQGMIDGCLLANCFLAGGETAEHPGVGLPKGYIDIGGFCVGFPDPALKLDPRANIRPGMTLWGWFSRGLGSNGFSLARRALLLRDDRPSRIQARLERYYPELGTTSLADALLVPTAIHVKNIEEQRCDGVQFIGHAHITGGGLPGNVPRILPGNCVASISLPAWIQPPIFHLIQDKGGISEREMLRTFNMGIQVVSVTAGDAVVNHPECKRIGRIRDRQGDEPQVEFKGRLAY